MNIEKIKNYNQKMLAVFFTLGVIFLLGCIIAIVIDLLPSRNYRTKPQGLIAEDNVNLLNEENLRKQVISYEMPWLIDTLKSTYIIPVSIKTLKKPEEVAINEELLGLMDASSSLIRMKKKGYYSHKQFNGEYANLIVYNPIEDRVLSLFNERIIIGNVEAYYFLDDILLIFYTALKDTNTDGVIDLSDLRNLNVYSLNAGDIRVIGNEENQVTGYSFIENSKSLLVEFELSQYKENQFEYAGAPKKIMKYDYNVQKLTDIIPDDIQKEMQKLVEGK